jgi:hypothetical protein
VEFGRLMDNGETTPPMTGHSGASSCCKLKLKLGLHALAPDSSFL